MAEAPAAASANPFIGALMGVGSNLLFDLLRKKPRQRFRSRQIPLRPRIQDYIPELQRYAQGQRG